MKEMLRMEELEGEDCLRLRGLWEEVFWEDSRAFTDYYFEQKATRNHAFAWKVDQEYISMLYLSPYPMMLRSQGGFVCREIYYIVGVATKKDGFFQYTAAGDSKHPVSVEKGKSARVYFEFQEMQDGGDVV